MKSTFSIDYRQNVGNTHINLQGYVTEQAVDDVLALIKNVHIGEGRIFVETKSLIGISKTASQYFKESFGKLSVSAKNFYIKGEKGMDLVPEGGRLILLKEKVEKAHKEHACSGDCKCNGRCVVCKCAINKLQNQGVR